MRAIEALGSLRVASANTGRARNRRRLGRHEVPRDPEARPIGPGLGPPGARPAQDPSSVSPYNFNLVGQEVGELAVDLGNRIVPGIRRQPGHFRQEQGHGRRTDRPPPLSGLPLLDRRGRGPRLGLAPLAAQERRRCPGIPHKLDEKVKAVSKGAYELLRIIGRGRQQGGEERTRRQARRPQDLAWPGPRPRSGSSSRRSRVRPQPRPGGRCESRHP